MKFLFYYRSVALICIAVLMPVLAFLGYGKQLTLNLHTTYPPPSFHYGCVTTHF